MALGMGPLPLSETSRKRPDWRPSAGQANNKPPGKRALVGEAEPGGERGPSGVFVSFSLRNKPLGAGRVTMSWRWWVEVVAGSGVFLGPLRSIVP